MIVSRRHILFGVGTEMISRAVMLGLGIGTHDLAPGMVTNVSGEGVRRWCNLHHEGMLFVVPADKGS